MVMIHPAKHDAIYAVREQPAKDSYKADKPHEKAEAIPNCSPA